MLWARGVHRAIGYGMLVGVVLQFYFAGLAAFGATSFAPHAATGYSLILGSVVLTLLALVGKVGRRVVSRSALVVGLTVLQPVLAFAPRVDAPAVSALHTLNALVILIVIGQLTLRPESVRPSRQKPI